MGTVINTNIQALNSQRALKVVAGQTEKASERLSSGLRINRAGDDAAGLAISEKMRNQIRGLNQASRNSQDGISLIQTAEGALQETHEMLKRMRELIVQASNDSNTTSDREKISLELNQLTDEIDATADKTEFNSKKLIDGSWSQNELYLHVGANTDQKIEFNIKGMDSVSLGVTKEAVGNVVATGQPNRVTKFNLTKDPISSSAAFGEQKTKDGGSVSISDKGIVSVKDASGKSTFYSINGNGDGSSIDKAKNLENLGSVELDDGATVSFDAATKSISLEAKAPAGGTVPVSLAELDGMKLNTGATINVKDNIVTFSNITQKAVDAENGVKISKGKYPLNGLEFESLINGLETQFKIDSNGDDVNITTTTPVNKGDTYKLADDNGLHYADLQYDGTSEKWVIVPLLPSDNDAFVDKQGNSLINKVNNTSAETTDKYSISFDGKGNATATFKATDLSAFTSASASTLATALATVGTFTLEGEETDNPSSITIDANGQVTIQKNDGSMTDLTTATNYDNLAAQLKDKSFVDKESGFKLTFDATGKLSVSQTVGDFSSLNSAMKKEYSGLSINTDEYNGSFKLNFDASGNAIFSDVSKLTAKTTELTDNEVQFYAASTTRNNVPALNTLVTSDLIDIIKEGVYNDTLSKVSLTFDGSGSVTATVLGGPQNNTEATVNTIALKDVVGYTGNNFVLDGGTTVLTFAGTGKIATITPGTDDGITNAANTKSTNDSLAKDLWGKSFTDASTGTKISFAADGKVSISQTVTDLTKLNSKLIGDFNLNISESSKNDSDYYGTVKVNLAGATSFALTAKMTDTAGLLDKPTITDVTFAKDMSSYVTSETKSISEIASEAQNSFAALDEEGNTLFNIKFSADGVTFTNIADVVNDKVISDAGFVNDKKYSLDSVAEKLDGQTLVDELGNSYTFMAGIDDDGNTTLQIEKSASTDELEASNGKTISDVLKVVDAAIEQVSTQRAELGAVQNRLEHTIKNLDTSSENLSSSESRIRDTDMAKEMMEFTKSNVLSQAAQSMLAQANQAPNNILSLLR